MAGSGALLVIMSEYFKIETQFGLKAHPMTSVIKIFHHFTNIIFVFAIGKIFNGHIQLGLSLKKKKKRITGFSISILIPLMMISGAAILYASSQDFMTLASDFHWYFGLSFTLSFIIHKFLP
jgi:hypothetical protein